MDFFQHQETARKKSHFLVFYFLLAVLGIIVSVYLLLIVFYYLMAKDGTFSLWEPGLFLSTSAGTAAVVFLASSYKSMQLSAGGKVVAQELGGRLIDSNSTDFYEKRLVNIVEEIAIASGIPVPDVYVMDAEESINAFAAGKTTSDAVVGVTRGCMTILSRDELQGVVAHEFAHILNGDMRLNMRLIGLLFGILFLALMGQMILRGSFYIGRSRSREGASLGVAILISGAGLFVIGSVGAFFARLIKASISRQREFLADASAVQFTRNPDGLAGALKKIGGLTEGSRISHPMAVDASHLFFGNALGSSALATHPPLRIRIKRLLPHWDGDYGSVQLPPITPHQPQQARPPRRASSSSASSLAGAMLAGDEGTVRINREEAIESISSIHREQIDLGHHILEEMPPHWIELARSPAGAQAMVFALLMDQDERLRESEITQLSHSVDRESLRTALKIHAKTRGIHSAVKLALIDLCIPSLRRLTPGEYTRFSQILNHLITSDQRVDLFEFTLQKMVQRHLDQYFQRSRTPRIRYTSIRKLKKEASVILTTISALSNPQDPDAIKEAFAAAAKHLHEIADITISFQPEERCGLGEVAKALDHFAMSAPPVKKQLVEASSAAVLTDGAVTSQEAELIRAIADAAGVGLPPIIRTAPLI